MATDNTRGKVALVTGGNKGIGFETARQLARQGITVLLGARDERKGAEAAKQLQAEGLGVEFLRLDVDDAATHANAARLIEERFGKLDILVNNAGVNLEGFDPQPASRVSPDVLRRTFDTNFFNLIALTQTLLPLVRKSDAGRVVNLSSVLGSLTLHADPTSWIYDFKVPAYDISKTALNAYTIHLAYELKDTPVKVNSAHPGWVKTDMGGEQAPMELEEGAKTSVWLATLPQDGPTGGYFHLGEPLPW
jgi:NAD(P)-dependent dehydrogenase (short-subunit alcohol dehydrogenase family)